MLRYQSALLGGVARLAWRSLPSLIILRLFPHALLPSVVANGPFLEVFVFSLLLLCGVRVACAHNSA
jgi:hypothetical protein